MAVPTSQHISLEPLFNDRFNDGYAHAVKVLDLAHSRVHSGDSFFAWKHATLANGEISALSIVTPNTTKWAHMTVSIRATSGADFTILEGGTITPGTAFVARNHNRNNAKTSGMTISVGQTGATLPTTTGTTVVYTEDVSAAKGIQWVRGNGSEVILKQNTGYLFKFTNGTLANTTSIVLEWYEQSNNI